jgi:hypothetical protein
MMKQEGQKAYDERNDRNGLHDLSGSGPVNAERSGYQNANPNRKRHTGPRSTLSPDGAVYNQDQHDQRESDSHRTEATDRPSVVALPPDESNGQSQAQGSGHGYGGLLSTESTA